jgi:hypothetical protein
MRMAETVIVSAVLFCGEIQEKAEIIMKIVIDIKITMWYSLDMTDWSVI